MKSASTPGLALEIARAILVALSFPRLAHRPRAERRTGAVVCSLYTAACANGQLGRLSFARHCVKEQDETEAREREREERRVVLIIYKKKSSFSFFPVHSFFVSDPHHPLAFLFFSFHFPCFSSYPPLIAAKFHISPYA